MTSADMMSTRHILSRQIRLGDGSRRKENDAVRVRMGRVHIQRVSYRSSKARFYRIRLFEELMLGIALRFSVETVYRRIRRARLCLPCGKNLAVETSQP